MQEKGPWGAYHENGQYEIYQVNPAKTICRKLVNRSLTFLVFPGI